MRVKDASVNLEGLEPRMRTEVLPAIEAAYLAHLEMVVTSAKDGQHSAHSLHYEGRAVDIRTRTLSTDTALEFCRAVKRALGPDFDVVLECDHLHVELDPKDPTRAA